MYASEGNKVLHVAELAQDYLSVLPHYTRVLEGLSREAPALFKHQVGEGMGMGAQLAGAVRCGAGCWVLGAAWYGTGGWVQTRHGAGASVATPAAWARL